MTILSTIVTSATVLHHSSRILMAIIVTRMAILSTIVTSATVLRITTMIFSATILRITTIVCLPTILPIATSITMMLPIPTIMVSSAANLLTTGTANVFKSQILVL
jgi:hypothetical protein